MIIKPIELINICALFPSLKTSYIPQEDFRKLVQDTKLIDSDNSIDSIIEDALGSGLVSFSSGYYSLTAKGKKICKHQEQPDYQLTDQTQEDFIKHVLVNVDSKGWCCAEFINKFKVDVELQTFVYERQTITLKDETNWLLKLSNAGLIEVEKEKAFVKKKYLGIVNEMLLNFRNPLHKNIKENENENTKLGDFAEKLAVQYEMDRLSAAGFSSLAPLVQQVSTVDQSAGYDILSFAGVGPQPNNSIYIEVKCTSRDEFCFHWSFNEMNVAKKEGGNYWIYGYTRTDLVTKCAEGPIKIKSPITNLVGLGYTISPLDCYISK